MNDILNTDEVSNYLGCSTETLRYWRQRGTGPKWFKLGHRVMYRRTDLEAWIGDAYAAQNGATA